MKRLFVLFVFLSALVLFPLIGFAAGDGAVVNNPNPADRLHLRKEPNASSASLGKYYNGTWVTVLEYRDDGWQKVGIGLAGWDGGKEVYQRVGYMMTQYLTHDFGGAAQKVKSAMPEYVFVETEGKLYSQPDKNSEYQALAYGSQVRLMGYTDTWWHVAVIKNNEIYKTGFMLANKGLGTPSIGVVNNPNAKDRLNLRTGIDTASTSLGKYYSGVKVQVLAFQADGLWVKVRIGNTEGYMMASYISIGSESGNVKSAIPTVRLTTDKVNLRETASLTGKALGQYALGTSVKVWGVCGTWLHVEVGGKSGYMLASMLASLPGEGSGSTPPPVADKAAKLKSDANFRSSASYTGTVLAYLGKGTKVTVQSQSGDWYYVRIGTTEAYGWILKSLVSLI